MSRQYISQEIQKKFMEKAVRSNRFLMNRIGVFVIGIELFNIVRVLFLSESGLGTLNNRIYFGFYFFLFILMLFFICLDRLLKKEDIYHYRLYMLMGSVFLIWNTLFGIYDISRSVSVGKITMATTLVVFSALFIMEPLYAVINLGLNYLAIILYLTINLGDSGAVINYGIVSVLSFVIYCARLKDIRTELLQEKKIEDINRVLEETEEKFRLTNAQYELILEHGKLIAFEWEIKDGTVKFSKEWKDIFGQPDRIENVEKFIRTIDTLQQKQREEILQCMEHVRKKVLYQKKDLLLPVKDGSQRWFELQLSLQTDRKGEPLCGIGLLSDIMDQKNRILELKKELKMDNFTKTLNKTAMEIYGNRKLKELREGERLAMLILDMDDFKNINDTYGHLCGDHVLVKVAELMNTLAPERARVGRLGGDEFGALLDLQCGETGAEEYAGKLIEAVHRIRWQGKSIPAACSVGVAFCERGTDYMELYDKADKALYEAKRMGKNCFFTI